MKKVMENAKVKVEEMKERYHYFKASFTRCPSRAAVTTVSTGNLPYRTLMNRGTYVEVLRYVPPLSADKSLTNLGPKGFFNQINCSYSNCTVILLLISPRICATASSVIIMSTFMQKLLSHDE